MSLPDGTDAPSRFAVQKPASGLYGAPVPASGQRVLPHGAIVRNTFLEFSEAQEDPWFVKPNPQRQKTDSLLERSSLSLRSELEQTIQSMAAAADVPLSLPVPSLKLERPDSSVGDYFNLSVPPPSAGRSPEESPEQDEYADCGDDFGQASGCQAQDAEVQRRREIAASGGGLSGATTVMIRHIPVKYNQRMLIREINGHGFSGKYDFIYLPMDQRSHANRGFAFVNFFTADIAMQFYTTFEGNALRHFEAELKIAIMPADLQGFEANAEHFASARNARRTRIAQNKPVFLRPLPPHLAGNGHSSGGKNGDQSHQQLASSEPRKQNQPRGASAASASQEAKFCAFCGKPKQADFTFCPFCGNRSAV
jgi:hypothetical protein